MRSSAQPPAAPNELAAAAHPLASELPARVHGSLRVGQLVVVRGDASVAMRDHEDGRTYLYFYQRWKVSVYSACFEQPG